MIKVNEKVVLGVLSFMTACVETYQVIKRAELSKEERLAEISKEITLAKINKEKEIALAQYKQTLKSLKLNPSNTDQ